ncbi:hypothetical protein RB653_005465 [Dictyostelium firmibasis]|uniref:Dynactin subunit 4 n=1 Tax=Dictyostelium firmibasis TaxID=79012 RepID=A0AAN7U801_9MYCE
MYSKRIENSFQFNKDQINNNIIKYSCNCGKSYHVSELYYCSGCLKTNCKFCITEEIDCFYCPNCLENVSSVEASLNGNRCKKCFDCPICFNILTYSASTNVSTGNETFFLNCAFCKWNSINSGEKEFRFDSHSIKNSKESTESQLQFNKVLEVVNKESIELTSLKDKKTLTRIKIAQAMKQFLGQQSKHQKYNQRKNFLKPDENQRWIQSSTPQPLPDNQLIPKSLSTTTTQSSASSLLLTNQMIKKSIQSQPITTQDIDDMQQKRIDSRVFKKVVNGDNNSSSDDNGYDDHDDHCEQYDDDIDLEEINEIKDSDEISNLMQRYHQVSNQCKELKGLIPQHRQLLTRRSKRCKRCDRLLVKPDINPGKIDFKRSHFAYTYIPRVTISKIQWIDQDLFQVFLTFTNPLHSYIFMSFPMEIKGSMVSLDDNSQLVDLYTNETFISGLLDEIDDNEKEVIIDQLKTLEEQNKRYFTNGGSGVNYRNGNKLTLGFIGKVGVEDALFSNNNNNTDEVTHLIIHLPDQLSLNNINDNDVDPPKFKSKFTSIKFTVVVEFSLKSTTTTNNTSGTNTSSSELGSSGTISESNSSQKTLLKILFDVPSDKFSNTEL